jgi:hypothetical protein
MDAQEAAAGSLQIQEDVRERIVARNKRRALKDKEYKLLRLVSGVHGITAYTCFTSAMALGVSNGGNAIVAAVLTALGSLCAYVFVAIWRNKLPPIWLVVLPSTIFVTVGLFLGAVLSLAFWLNVAAHIEVPFLYRFKKQIASLPS